MIAVLVVGGFLAALLGVLAYIIYKENKDR